MIGPLFKSLKLVIYQSISTITIMNLSKDLDVEQNRKYRLISFVVQKYRLYFVLYYIFGIILLLMMSTLCKDFQIGE